MSPRVAMWPVHEAQCLEGQKGSMTINCCHCGQQSHGFKDAHDLVPETRAYATSRGKGTLQI